MGSSSIGTNDGSKILTVFARAVFVLSSDWPTAALVAMVKISEHVNTMGKQRIYPRKTESFVSNEASATSGASNTSADCANHSSRGNYPRQFTRDIHRSKRAAC